MRMRCKRVLSIFKTCCTSHFQIHADDSRVIPHLFTAKYNIITDHLHLFIFTTGILCVDNIKFIFLHQICQLCTIFFHENMFAVMLNRSHGPSHPFAHMNSSRASENLVCNKVLIATLLRKLLLNPF